jgi:hypothetical protein
MPINSFLYPAPSLPPAYSVANSCLFNRADGSNMTKTPGSSGDLRKWTWSCWVKRGTISNGSQTMFNAGSSSNTQIRFESDDTINFYQYSSSYTARLATNAKYRDPSAWMHVVAHWDTDNSTAGDRMKLFVNGTEVTSFAADVNPALNLDSYWNASGTAMYVGDKGDGAEEMDGYLAEVVFIDGQNLAPTSFGEFDEDSPNIWKPIDVSGLTFGTNGFYLEFKQSGTSANSSGIGADTSGNDHHFTVNNITAIDQTTDTCTNNFCTLNPLTISGATLSEGNLKYTHTQNGEYRTVLGTFGLDSGKWYWEVKIVSEDGYRPVSGIASTQDTPYYQPAYSSLHLGKGNASAGLFTHGDMQLNGSSGTAPDTLDNNDITGFALDLDSGTNTLAVYKNGSLDETYNLTTVGTYGSYTPAITGYHSANNVMEINFGNPSFSISSGNSDANGYGSFEYSVPSGYYSLCTKNLAEYGG